MWLLLVFSCVGGASLGDMSGSLTKDDQSSLQWFGLGVEQVEA